jgi:hypothetical protein
MEQFLPDWSIQLKTEKKWQGFEAPAICLDCAI